MSLQFRRGTNAERLLITPAQGEPVWTTDTSILYVGDGETVGGLPINSGGGSAVTEIIAGDNITVNTSTGAVTITAVVPATTSTFDSVQIGTGTYKMFIGESPDPYNSQFYITGNAEIDDRLYFDSWSLVQSNSPFTVNNTLTVINNIISGNIDGNEGAVTSMAQFRSAFYNSGGYAFKGDANYDTGMFYDGSNELTLAVNRTTGGAEFTFDNFGNLTVPNVLNVGPSTGGSGYITSTGDSNLILQTSGNDGPGASIVLTSGAYGTVELFAGNSQETQMANFNTGTGATIYLPTTINAQTVLVGTNESSYPSNIPLEIRTYTIDGSGIANLYAQSHRGTVASPESVQQGDTALQLESIPFTGAWADSNVFEYLAGSPLDGYSYGPSYIAKVSQDFGESPLYFNHVEGYHQLFAFNTPDSYHPEGTLQVTYATEFIGNKIRNYNGDFGTTFGGLDSTIQITPTLGDGTEVPFVFDSTSAKMIAPAFTVTNTSTIAQATIGLNNGARAFGNGYLPSNANNMKFETPNNGASFIFAMKNPSGVEKNVGISRQGNVVFQNGLLGNGFPSGMGLSSQDGGPVNIVGGGLNLNASFDDGENIFKGLSIIANTSTGITMSLDSYDYATDTEVYTEMVMGFDGSIKLPTVNTSSVQFNFDASDSMVLNLATDDTLSFGTFSGEILVNDLYDGNMYKFLVGGGHTSLIGHTNYTAINDGETITVGPTSSGSCGITNWVLMDFTSGYTFTNLASERQYSFYAVRTRASS